MNVFKRLKEQRKIRKQKGFSFGVEFLDDSLKGIAPQDLVVIGARSGEGKTQLASHITMKVLKQGRGVGYMALEADPDEIEERLLYKKLSNMWWDKNKGKAYHKAIPDMQEWMWEDQEELFKDFESKAEKQLDEELKQMKVIYKGTGGFSTEEIRNFVAENKLNCELFVIDHLHYVDKKNSQQEFHELIQEIRHIGQEYKRAMVVVSHVRKEDLRLKQPLPLIEDLHGSSDIYKIATKVILMAKETRAYTGQNSLTYVRAVKNRANGAVAHYNGVMNYDTSRNEFLDGYSLVKFYKEKGEWKTESLKTEEVPRWAKGSTQYKTKLEEYESE